MRTTSNLISKLTRTTLIIALSFSTIFTVSCQNAAHQTFLYKTDFIKQMVYQVSNDFLSRNGFVTKMSSNNQKATAVLMNYSVSEKNMKHSAKYDETELAAFLTEAAQLNTNAPIAEMEKDYTLELLTSAAQLNSEVASDNNNDETLTLLINAAQLNSEVATEDNNQDSLLDFLTNAADLNHITAE